MRRGIQTIRRTATGARLGRLLERLSRRWTLRVVWELRGEALNFRALQAACGGISPSVMQARLRELRQLGVVEQIPGLGYRLTARGQALFRAIAPLSDWAEKHVG